MSPGELSEVEHVKAVLRSAERDYQHRIKELQSTLAERDKRIAELESECSRLEGALREIAGDDESCWKARARQALADTEQT